jgi:peptidoglycan/LPS O-acetylase OafA/YrhL
MTEIIKTYMTLAFSRRLALLFGFLLPVAELVRRSQQLGSIEVLPHLVDDFLIGGCLLYAALRSRREPLSGRRYLAAAWGAACGMGYYSFAGQLMPLSQPDPAPISPAGVAMVKGIGLLLCIAALAGCLRDDHSPPV